MNYTLRFVFTLLMGLALSPAQLNAQFESSSFNLTGLGAATPFARDYQSLQINPGNLDMETGYEQQNALGFFEITASMYTELLNKQQIRDGLLGRSKNQTLTYEEQLAKVEELTLKPTAINANFLSLGTWTRMKKAGALAFSISDKMDFYASIDRNLTELFWMGNQSSYFDSLIVQGLSGADSTIGRPENFDPNQFNIISAFISANQAQSVNQFMGKTKVGFNWYREFTLGYGKRIINTRDFEFNIGLAGKFILGQGILQLDGEKGQAYSSLSPIFKFDYSMLENMPTNPSALPSDAPDLKPVGKGFGVNVGGTFLFKKQLIINAAVNDIGQMKWDGNVYELGDGKITDFADVGIESLDLASALNSFNDLDAILKWKGAESRVTRLNTTARLGIGYEKLQKLRIGFDLIAPLNDNKANLQQSAFNAGIEFTPWPWLHLQTGFSEGGNFGRRMPAGIYFTAREGGYEFGFATRDLLTYWNDENPTSSMAFGFLRFRY